jgi:hypothetical protein
MEENVATTEALRWKNKPNKFSMARDIWLILPGASSALCNYANRKKDDLLMEKAKEFSVLADNLLNSTRAYPTNEKELEEIEYLILTINKLIKDLCQCKIGDDALLFVDYLNGSIKFFNSLNW